MNTIESPLSIDKETIKKYGIKPEDDISPLQKLAFLQNQLQEIQAMQWRSRVDIIHASRLAESENEVLKNKGLTNKGQHLNEVEQTTGAIAMLKKMIAELRADHKELQVKE